MLRKNFLKEKLRMGKHVVGTWSVMPSVTVADVIATSGIDFLIIDSEHGPINFETAQSMVIACESREVSPVMRLGGIIESDILRALDIGVHCVQIPNIKESNDIGKLIEYAKYPPIGNRGFSPFTRAGGYSLLNAQEVTAKANTEVLLAIQIEGKEALNNVEEIVSFDPVDIVFLGLFDISKSLGIPGDVDSPAVINTLKEIVEKINFVHKYAGTIVTEADQLKRCIDLGVKYITYSVDCEVLSRAYRHIETVFRELTDRQ